MANERSERMENEMGGTGSGRRAKEVTVRVRYVGRLRASAEIAIIGSNGLTIGTPVLVEFGTRVTLDDRRAK